jgi:hypothetical protein
MTAKACSAELPRRPCSACRAQGDYTLTWLTVRSNGRDQALGAFRVEHACELHLGAVVLGDDPPQRVEELAHMKSRRLARERDARARRRADYRDAHVPLTGSERICTDCGMPTVDLSGLCGPCIGRRRRRR